MKLKEKYSFLWSGLSYQWAKYVRILHFDSGHRLLDNYRHLLLIQGRIFHGLQLTYVNETEAMPEKQSIRP